MLRYSVYYKAFNDIYINPNNEPLSTYINTLKTIDDRLTQELLNKIEPPLSTLSTTDLKTEEGIDKIVDKLYPAECNPYDMSYNILGKPDQKKNLEVIKSVAGLFEQLQLRFNYESMDKCGGPIILNNYMTSLKNHKDNDNDNNIDYDKHICNKTDDNYLSSKMAHDYYVYLHRGIKKGTDYLYFIRLLKIVGKIQNYIYKNYKYRRCFN
jgi:hypothetical protein